jgi:hypothetical protein
LIFDRRGSGKSSLLRKAGADLTLDRRPIAYINLETFKEHSYPDVLVSVLLQTFKELQKWMETAAIHPATKTTFWTRLFGVKPKRGPYNKVSSQEVVEKLKLEILALSEQLHKTDGARR